MHGIRRIVVPVLFLISVCFGVAQAGEAARKDPTVVMEKIWRTLHPRPYACSGQGLCDPTQFVSYRTFQNISGLAVFASGPRSNHGDIDTESKKAFSHYNPAFVKWLVTYAIPAAHDEITRKATQPIYDRYLRSSARQFYTCYLAINAYKRIRNLLLQDYQRTIDDGNDYNPTLERLSSFVTTITNNKQYSGIYGEQWIVAFWLRRIMDGTDRQFFSLVTKLLNTYDRSGKRAIDTEFSHLPAESPLTKGTFEFYNSETGRLLPISTKHVSGYVAEPTLSMHVLPSQQAKLVSVLKIGEPVRMLSSHEQWVEVQSRADYSRGWVRKVGITKLKPSLKTLRLALSEEKLPNARRSTLAAILALSPYDLPALRQYAGVLNHEGQGETYKAIEERIRQILDSRVNRQPNEPRYLFLSDGSEIEPLAIYDTGISAKYNLNNLLRKEFHPGRKVWLYSEDTKLGMAVVTKGDQPGDVSQGGCSLGVSAAIEPVGIAKAKLSGFMIASNYPLNLKPHRRETLLTKNDLHWFKALALSMVRTYAHNGGDKGVVELDNGAGAEQVVYGQFSKTAHDTVAYLANFNTKGEGDGHYFSVIIAKRDSAGVWHKIFAVVDGGNDSATATLYPPYGAIDVTGDGIDELFYSAGYYEWNGTHILSFSRGIWHDVFANEGGC